MAARDLIRELVEPMTVLPTNTSPLLEPLQGIRAVVLDVYGTMLQSGAGDLTVSADSRADAALEALQAEGIVTSPTMTLQEQITRIIHLLHAQSKANGTEFPEIEIREVWARALARWNLYLEPEVLERVIIRHECAANPTAPMPGVRDMLKGLRDRALTLGIISNAQFYTRPLLEVHLGASLEEWGFCEDHCFWSFEEREAKPSDAPFVGLARRFWREGIRTQDVLYIGNDLRNDIAPAALAGFQTALFAGDGRSLRWRQGEGIEARPDAVLTAWEQLPTVLDFDSEHA